MKKTRVAVYRRVPRDQKSYAGLIGADERRINSESSMLYAGSYIDQDGCRGAFKRLMAAAGEGDIDRIETESISAFANNIGELLTTVCKLRCLRHPVVIHFEEEDVTTGTDDWEHCVCFLISQYLKKMYEENKKYHSSQLKLMENDKPLSVLIYNVDDSLKFKLFKTVCNEPGSNAEVIAETIECSKEEVLKELQELDVVDGLIISDYSSDDEYKIGWYRR